MRHIIQVCGMTILLCLPWTVFSKPVAKVLFVSGKARVVRSGQTLSIRRGSDLSIGDEIKTSQGGSVRLRYLNGSLVTLSREAIYQIQKFSPQQDVEIEASLSKGQARIETEGDASKKEVLNTKVVAMAIIGTDVTAYVADGSTLEVNLRSGNVNIDGISIRPGVYNVNVDQDNNVTITTPDGREVSEPSTDAEEGIISLDSEAIAQLISTNIAAEAGQNSAPDSTIATIAIV